MYAAPEQIHRVCIFTSSSTCVRHLYRFSFNQITSVMQGAPFPTTGTTLGEGTCTHCHTCPLTMYTRHKKKRSILPTSPPPPPPPHTHRVTSTEYHNSSSSPTPELRSAPHYNVMQMTYKQLYNCGPRNSYPNNGTPLYSDAIISCHFFVVSGRYTMSCIQIAVVIIIMR